MTDRETDGNALAITALCIKRTRCKKWQLKLHCHLRPPFPLFVLIVEWTELYWIWERHLRRSTMVWTTRFTAQLGCTVIIIIIYLFAI